MSSRFRIGDLTLDTGRRMFLRDSEPIPLGALTYRLLMTLVEAAPNMVSHDQLIDSIWAGSDELQRLSENATHRPRTIAGSPRR